MNRGRPPSAETQAERGQGSLFDQYDAETPRYQQARGAIHTHGEYVAAIGRTVAAAQAEDALTEVDAAGVALLIAGARSLEALEATGKPYGSAKLIPAMAEVLREYHLTPESRPQATTDDKIAALLAEMARNDDADDAAAPVRHEA